MTIIPYLVTALIIALLFLEAWYSRAYDRLGVYVFGMGSFALTMVYLFG